ncbi:peptidoglycan-binding domain-containing protein [Sphingomonas parapaucimobilis]|uniref:peptidoglycan-binding domain-containing protein n=1 Tax=Sphingomonas parapaucimobilis TaxID=28213 RepID=UPI00321969B8
MILKQGLHGEDVKKVQHQLRQFQPALQVDGVFGPRTEQAVRVAQGRLVLYPPDGIAGLQTFAALGRRSRRVPERSDRPARPAGSGAQAHCGPSLIRRVSARNNRLKLMRLSATLQPCMCL